MENKKYPITEEAIRKVAETCPAIICFLWNVRNGDLDLAKIDLDNLMLQFKINKLKGPRKRRSHSHLKLVKGKRL